MKFSPSQIETWESTKPWNLSREDAEYQRVPGWKSGRSRGTESASFEGGFIVPKDDFYELPEEARRAIAYHEAGHAMIEAAGGLRAIESISGYDFVEVMSLPGASSLSYSAEEVFAEAYSVLWTEPQWFDRSGATEIKESVIRLAQKARFPLPQLARSLASCRMPAATSLRGGEVMAKKEFWDKENPDEEDSDELTPDQKAKAKRRAKDNGRPYPNMVDNAWASKEGAKVRRDIRSLAYGEISAPSKVDTLRMKECPVCGDGDSWDSEGRCRTCGYLMPPEPFREPDLDVAQKVDMRDGEINPDLYRSMAFEEPEEEMEEDEDEEEYEEDEEEEEDKPRTVSSSRSPRKIQKSQQGAHRMQSISRQRQIINAQAKQIQTLQAQNRRLRRFADANNPAQPWPEGPEEAPAATTEGTIPSAINSDVDVTVPGGWQEAPMAQSFELTTPGGVIPASSGVAQDVTSPVAGGVEIPVADVRTEVDVNHDGETLGEVAYADGEWATSGTTASSKRTFASLRLARLRIESGIDSGEEIALAERISRSAMSNDQIRTEIETLSKVQARSSRSGRTASRQAVRNVPSLVSTAAPVVRVDAPSMTPGDDEFLWA